MQTVRDERFYDWFNDRSEPPVNADVRETWDAAWEAALQAVLAQAPSEDAASDAYAAWREMAPVAQSPSAQQREWADLSDQEREVFFAVAARVISGAVHQVRERPASTAS